MEAKQDLNDAVIGNNNTPLINSFCEITSSSREEALFFLESHQWNLDAAVSTFLDNNFNNNNINDDEETVAASSLPNPRNTTSRVAVNSPSPTDSRSPDYSPSQSPSRSRSRSMSPDVPSRAAYRLRSRDKATAGGGGRRQTRGGVRTLADLNRTPQDASDDDDQSQEYYTGGERSGMLVKDPTKPNDADSIFDQAKSQAVERPADMHRASSSSRSFTGRGRLLSGETVEAAPQPPEAVNHTVTLWRNGFTVDDGPLRSFDDPANASFLQCIKNSVCPKELIPADKRTEVRLDLQKREENYKEPERPKVPFQGLGRTLATSSNETTPSVPTFPALPVFGITVDSSLPTTSIQLRLADGTRMVARFNLHHTISDIRGFINASRPGGQREYQLQAMGFPPKQLTDAYETIEKAGIANSVVIQKF